MSQAEKLLAKLLRKPTPKDFTWDELCIILTRYGFELEKTGQSGGSARRFVHTSGINFRAHEPHPSNILKKYQIDAAITALKQVGALK
nr:MAG TPA: hypothetical protein [Caudoviricetes sp.]